MTRYAQLPDHIREALQQMPPTDGGDILYYLCKVALKSGLVSMVSAASDRRRFNLNSQTLALRAGILWLR